MATIQVGRLHLTEAGGVHITDGVAHITDGAVLITDGDILAMAGVDTIPTGVDITHLTGAEDTINQFIQTLTIISTDKDVLQEPM